jgi:hypothetical protein
VIKMQTIKRSQMMNSEMTRLFSKMLMIGQLKKSAPRTNINIQTSLLMGISPDRRPLSLGTPAAAAQSPPEHRADGSTFVVMVS